MYKQEQKCPYCGYEEDGHNCNFDTDGDGITQCSKCDKEYIAEPQFTFEGWEIRKICDVCGSDYHDVENYNCCESEE